VRELTSDQLREMWATLARPPKESIEIHDAVEQILADNPRISRQEAFRRLSEASGQKLGNISTAYYRQARRLRGGQTAKAATQHKRAGSGAARLDELQSIADQLSKLAAQLVDGVAEERRQLEEERAKVEKAKQAIMNA
jgi:hypothetical protein